MSTVNKQIDYSKRRFTINTYMQKFNSCVRMFGQTSNAVQAFKSEYSNIFAQTAAKQIADLTSEETEFFWVLTFLGMYNTNFVKWNITSERVSSFNRYSGMIQRGGQPTLYQILNQPGINQKVAEALRYCWGDLLDSTDTDQSLVNEGSNANLNSSATSIEKQAFIEFIRQEEPKGKFIKPGMADEIYKFIADCKERKAYLIYTNERLGSSPRVYDIASLFDAEHINGKIKVLVNIAKIGNKSFSDPKILIGKYNETVDEQLTQRFLSIIDVFKYTNDYSIYTNIFYKFLIFCMNDGCKVYTRHVLEILSALSKYDEGTSLFGSLIHYWVHMYDIPVDGREYNRELTPEQQARAICPTAEIQMLIIIYHYIDELRYILVRKNKVRHAGLFFGKKENVYSVKAVQPVGSILKIQYEKPSQTGETVLASAKLWLGARLFDKNRKDLQMYICDSATVNSALNKPEDLDSLEAMYNDEDSEFFKVFKSLPKNGMLYNYMKESLSENKKR